MTKKELISTIKPRYLKSNKSEKSKILDEFCQNTGYNRKYVIKILQADYDNNRVKIIGRKPRKKIYTNEVILLAIKIWELLEYPCGQRLKGALSPMIDSLIRCDELKISDDLRNKLSTISTKTLDRRLKKERTLK